MQPGVDCFLVYDLDTLNMTCYDDWTLDFIEEDPLGFSNDFKQAVKKYTAELSKDRNTGFGYRNLTASH